MALPTGLLPLLEVVAFLERATLPLLERALEGRDVAEDLVEQAVPVEALTLDEDELVRFTHPLLASAVCFRVAARRRRAPHRHLAGLVDDVEERARHGALAASGPDAATAGLVEQAAAAAGGRGALDAAAELRTRPRAFTPAVETDAWQRRVLAGAAGWSRPGAPDPHLPQVRRPIAQRARARLATDGTLQLH